MSTHTATRQVSQLTPGTVTAPEGLSHIKEGLHISLNSIALPDSQNLIGHGLPCSREPRQAVGGLSRTKDGHNTSRRS